MLGLKRLFHRKPEEDTPKKCTDMVAIPYYWPNGNLTSVPYRPYSPLYDELKDKLDEHLELLFAGNVDDANGDALDALIIDHIRQAINDYTLQRSEHRDAIFKLHLNDFGTYQDITAKKEILEKEVAALQETYERYAGRSEEF